MAQFKVGPRDTSGQEKEIQLKNARTMHTLIKAHVTVKHCASRRRLLSIFFAPPRQLSQFTDLKVVYN